MKHLLIFLVFALATQKSLSAGPEMKVYEIQEELLLPFFTRALGQPAELEALLLRMDQMDGGGKLRVLGDLEFREPTDADRNGVIANHPSAPEENDAIKYQVSGRWYHDIGPRTLTMNREIRKGVYLPQPTVEITLGHILGKEWSLSLVVATADAYLVIVERWTDSPQENPSTGWVVAPSPSEKIKLTANRMPPVLRDFPKWGSGALIVRLPRHHVEWASSAINIRPQSSDRKQPGQNLELAAEIRFHRDQESLVTLKYDGKFVHKLTTDGYTYDNSSGTASVKLVNPLNIGVRERQIVRTRHIETQDGYKTVLEPTKEKTLIQLAVFKDELQ